MRSKLVNLTDRQHTVLVDHAESIGISVSELIRRILDLYLDSASFGNTLLFGGNVRAQDCEEVDHAGRIGKRGYAKFRGVVRS